jgi:hypothetical protein
MCLQQEGFHAPTMFLMHGTQTRTLLRILTKTACVYLRQRALICARFHWVHFFSEKKQKLHGPLLSHIVF